MSHISLTPLQIQIRGASSAEEAASFFDGDKGLDRKTCEIAKITFAAKWGTNALRLLSDYSLSSSSSSSSFSTSVQSSSSSSSSLSSSSTSSSSAPSFFESCYNFVANFFTPTTTSASSSSSSSSDDDEYKLFTLKDTSAPISSSSSLDSSFAKNTNAPIPLSSSLDSHSVESADISSVIVLSEDLSDVVTSESQSSSMDSYRENLEAEARSFPFYPSGTTVSERITLLERNTALFKKEEALRNRSCLEKTVEKITPFAADVFAACFCAAVSFVDPSYALFAEVVYTANIFLTE